MDSFTDILHMLQVVFGIGLVIFVHEGGHFIAARMCGVRVEVFSLGFGPRLFSWRRGATLYQIAAVPLGGYVRMAGEDQHGRDPDEPARDYELGGKSVGQRFFIYSGGVLMNVVFALVAFPLVLLAGLPSLEPMVSEPAPGTPAWHARIPAGTRIETINGHGLFDFFHIHTGIAVGGSDPAELELLLPGAEATKTLTLQPMHNENTGTYAIGVSPGIDRENRLRVAADSPATKAGIEPDDVLLEVVGGMPGRSLAQQLRLAFNEEAPVTLRLERGGTEQTVEVVPERAMEAARNLLGIGPEFVHVMDFRDTELTRSTGLRIGDRVLKINDQEIHRNGDVLKAIVLGVGQPLQMTWTRGLEELTFDGPVFTHAEALAFADDLFISADQESTLVTVTPGSGADKAGVMNGDELISIGAASVDSYAEFLPRARRATRTLDPVDVTVRRAGADGDQILTLAVTPSEWAPKAYGFNLRPAEYVYQVDNVSEAISVGVYSSWRMLVDTGLTLRRMVIGEVSGDNLGGIITISVVSHQFASLGWAKLFFFLCILSVNLAFLNVLPIPVLDGGHLMFLLIEKIKGSPVSERMLGYSQIVGLVLIVALMVFVTYNDVMRWFFPES
jgi:regulator of sigma E protease